MADEPEVPISHLQRRKIEGRVLIPMIEACREKFGEAAARDLVLSVIHKLAAQDGARWAGTYGKDIASLRQVADKVWAGGGGMEIEVLGEDKDRLDFNVTRCRYAEFFKELGLADMGYLVQCSRDFAMIDGYNKDLALTRTQTIMQGASHCDFRFRTKAGK